MTNQHRNGKGAVRRKTPSPTTLANQLQRRSEGDRRRKQRHNSFFPPSWFLTCPPFVLAFLPCCTFLLTFLAFRKFSPCLSGPAHPRLRSWALLFFVLMVSVVLYDFEHSIHSTVPCEVMGDPGMMHPRIHEVALVSLVYRRR